MRREGKLRGKPTNKTRQRGKCKVVHCHMCHLNSPCKSACKTKGQKKFTQINIDNLMAMERVDFFDYRWNGRRGCKY